MLEALINGRVLCDDGLVSGQTVLLESGRILDVVAPDDPRCATATQVDLREGLLLPGFIDTQVNGGGGMLFNDDPSVATIGAIASAHRRFGTTGMLPTLISDDLQVVGRAIDAVRDAMANNVPGVLGIHIEGPFLSEARKGTHDASKFRMLDSRAVARLTSLKAGRTLVTLAPEMTTPAMIASLVAAGVVVSAGHSNASYAVTKAALGAGVTGFTHLFNAMSPFGSREPGVVGAALEDQNSWCGIIVDGHHVSPVALRIAMRCRPPDRFMLVTDAMSTVGTNADSFMLQGKKIAVRDGKCVDDQGTLSGSCLDMASAVRNAVTMLGVGLPEAVRMASTYPAQFLGLGHELGRIAPGYRANLALANDELVIVDTWIDGQSTHSHAMSIPRTNGLGGRESTC